MKKGENIRLDEVLVLKGLCESRSQAKAFIMAGQVWLGTERLEKASKLISPELEIYLKSPMKYVGRGGLKMENFLIHSQIDPSGLRILDIGASTGDRKHQDTDSKQGRGNQKQSSCKVISHQIVLFRDLPLLSKAKKLKFGDPSILFLAMIFTLFSF